MSATALKIPTVLFGAFDRHNFGDLLVPHVAAALLGRENLIFAGLANRDLRSQGGHRVQAIADVAARLRTSPANIIHVGGEVLGCDAWEAAVMLLPPEEAQSTIAHFASRPLERLAWAHRVLGNTALAPYTLQCDLFPSTASITYNAVGGVDIDTLEHATLVEVLANLRAADVVFVRDRQTASLLQGAGIPARLMPDPVAMMAELFGSKILHNSKSVGIADLPQGYIAVQFSADFGDDEILDTMAKQLDELVDETGLGIVFFRAGAAPWHDELAGYQRLISRMRTAYTHLFTSLNAWDICALIAGSKVYCGSSLHGRIVAMAFALPRVNLSHPGQAKQHVKRAAYAVTWDMPGMPVLAGMDDIASSIHAALATDREQRRQTSVTLAAQYRRGFDAIRAALK